MGGPLRPLHRPGAPKGRLAKQLVCLGHPGDVLCMQTVQLFVAADNPGQWMLHCHTAVHMEAGMMTRLDYTT